MALSAVLLVVLVTRVNWTTPTPSFTPKRLYDMAKGGFEAKNAIEAKAIPIADQNGHWNSKPDERGKNTFKATQRTDSFNSLDNSFQPDKLLLTENGNSSVRNTFESSLSETTFDRQIRVSRDFLGYRKVAFVEENSRGSIATPWPLEQLSNAFAHQKGKYNEKENISQVHHYLNMTEKRDSRQRKAKQTAIGILKKVLETEMSSNANKTSPLDHSKRFRELTKRRKYSMNFVKGINESDYNDETQEPLSDTNTSSRMSPGDTEDHFTSVSKQPTTAITGLASDIKADLNHNTTINKTTNKTYDETTTNLPYLVIELVNKPSNESPFTFTRALNLTTTKLIPSRPTSNQIITRYHETPTIRNFLQLPPLVVTSLAATKPHQDTVTRPAPVRRTAPTPSTLKMAPTADPWPVKQAAEIPGDLILGGLMMVHEREDSVTCGPIMPQGGIQALETMLYTLDVVNNMPGAPFTLGAHILDDCDKDTYGLEMAVDFIKGSISNIEDAEFSCNKTQVRKVISGVVGAASSVTSIQVANLLRLFKIPQVSFFSTSPELSNKQRFEYFTRTIPSDHHQVKAMVEIVRRLGWSYVSIIYEESNYGIKAFEELEGLLAKYEICIAVKEKLVKDSGVAEETAYDSIVHRLLTKPRARGAIIFGSDQEVAGLMRAVRRCNATGSFSWIGSDGWSARSLVWQGNEREVEGTLSVQPQANPVQGFDRYFLNLTADNNRRNPWFIEFWEHHFQCRYPNSSRTPHNQKHQRMCTTKERLTAENTVFENQLQFVSDAVMAFAVALRDMHRELCAGRPGLCEHMRPTKGPDLLKYLRKVNFEGLSGDKFKFDTNGDGPARYNIIHFKQSPAGSFQWFKVGEYIEGELTLNMSDIQFRHGESVPPESVCSLPCELGQAKQYVEGESCCWHCFNCTTFQVRHLMDETQCVMCAEGTVPDPTKQRCLEIPEEFLKAESAWAIGAMCLSATGIIITLLVAGVFVRHNNTPVVKAAGRELSYVLLMGILLCYSVTFALVLRPSNVVCGIQRFGTGFCFTVVYAALFTKTNRISRIFNAGKRTTKRPNFISPKSQLIICSGLVSVQVLINAVWMIVSPPRAIHHYPTREDNLLVCASYVNASYMIAFGYPILLILVCTVYAVLTRNIPEAFNESKHIGFTMYTTCVIWLAFVPLYFGTGHHMPLRITSMSVTISLSASVTLVCLFSPKLYIILVRPDRNVRQSMMASRHGLFKSGTTASVMVGAAPIAHTHQPFAQVLTQRECIALEVNEDTKKHKKDKVQTTTKFTQTTSPLLISNRSPSLAKVNNVVNSISSFVENGPPAPL